MLAGQLRQRVTIQKDTPTQDVYGQPVASWGTHLTRWASVEPLTGREAFTAAQMQSTVTTRIRVRWSSGHGITPKMRVSWDGRLFEIDSVVEVGSGREELHLMCTEVQG